MSVVCGVVGVCSCSCSWFVRHVSSEAREEARLIAHIWHALKNTPKMNTSKKQPKCLSVCLTRSGSFPFQTNSSSHFCLFKYFSNKIIIIKQDSLKIFFLVYFYLLRPPPPPPSSALREIFWHTSCFIHPFVFVSIKKKYKFILRNYIFEKKRKHIKFLKRGFVDFFFFFFYSEALEQGRQKREKYLIIFLYFKLNIFQHTYIHTSLSFIYSTRT